MNTFPRQSLHSCVICRSRKVRCDRQIPSCSKCVKADQKCTFPRSRAPRKSSVGVKSAELLKRLQRLEGVVEELSRQVDRRKSRGKVEQLSGQEMKAVEQVSLPYDSSSSDSGEAGSKSHFVRPQSLKSPTFQVTNDIHNSNRAELFDPIVPPSFDFNLNYYGSMMGHVFSGAENGIVFSQGVDAPIFNAVSGTEHWAD